MKKVLKFLCSRLVIVTLAILVQFCFLLFIVLKLSTYGLYAYVSLQLISLVVVLWIVTKRDNHFDFPYLRRHFLSGIRQ